MFLFIFIPLWTTIGFILGFSLGMLISGVEDKRDVSSTISYKYPEKEKEK